MTTYVEDFNGSGLVLPWTTIRDNFPWALNGDGSATLNTTGSTYQKVEADVGSTDQFSEILLRRGWQNISQGDPRVVLLLRAGAGTTQTYYAASMQLTNDSLQFLYWNNGTPTEIGPAVTVPVAGSDGALGLRFEVVDSVFRYYFNGALVNEVTNTARNVGNMVGCGVQRGTTIKFDEFRGGAIGDAEPGRMLLAA